MSGVRKCGGPKEARWRGLQQALTNCIKGFTHSGHWGAMTSHVGSGPKNSTHLAAAFLTVIYTPALGFHSNLCLVKLSPGAQSPSLTPTQHHILVSGLAKPQACSAGVPLR